MQKLEKKFMNSAFLNASKSELCGDIPVGAVIVYKDKIISNGCNEVIKRSDPTAHAEIIAIRDACKILNTYLLEECDLYVTLEPCAMCAQAISLAKIKRLYFGAYSPKYGGVEHGCRVFDFATHKTEVIGGILETQCATILQDFFKKRR